LIAKPPDRAGAHDLNLTRQIDFRPLQLLAKGFLGFAPPHAAIIATA